MAFTGKYELESQENFDQLMEALGFSNDIIKKYKGITSVIEFVQNGNSFQCIYHFGNRVVKNNFTIGQESEFVSFTGHKVKALAKLEGENKLVVTMHGLTAVMELRGDRIIETITNGDVAFKKISKRI